MQAAIGIFPCIEEPARLARFERPMHIDEVADFLVRIEPNYPSEPDRPPVSNADIMGNVVVS